MEHSVVMSRDRAGTNQVAGGPTASRRHTALRRIVLIPVGLMFSLLAACSSGYVNDNYYDPRENEYVPTEEEIPSQLEIDQNFERDLREIESEVDFNVTECVDITSYDFDWSNDMRCTRPDGTVFYTDYAGAASEHGRDPEAACRNDGTPGDARLAKFLRKKGLCG